MGKSADSIILSSSAETVSANNKKYIFEKLERNVLYEITDECLVTTEMLRKQMTINRQPKKGYSHIVEEEIFHQIDAINNVIEYGSRFISSH
jgi:glucosamine 6-phosphate synthetase-like amidotransferase/phosphosugar isomerase protein